MAEKDERRKKDINRATREDLMEVEGIDEYMAGRILQHRVAAGQFEDMSQLEHIDDLDEKRRRAILERFGTTRPPDERED